MEFLPVGSYSFERWAIEMAERLRSAGVDATIDPRGPRAFQVVVPAPQIEAATEILDDTGYLTCSDSETLSGTMGQDFSGWIEKGKLVGKRVFGFPTSACKWWRGIGVDLDIKDEWLDRMNLIPGLTMRATCAAHGKESHPFLVACFPTKEHAQRGAEHLSAIAEVQTPFYDRMQKCWDLSIRSPFAYGEITWVQHERWWETLVAALENLADPAYKEPPFSREDLLVGEFLVETRRVRPEEPIWFQRDVPIRTPDGRALEMDSLAWHGMATIRNIFNDLALVTTSPEHYTKEGWPLFVRAIDPEAAAEFVQGVPEHVFRDAARDMEFGRYEVIHRE